MSHDEPLNGAVSSNSSFSERMSVGMRQFDAGVFGGGADS
jgi:hypothetical protein